MTPPESSAEAGPAHYTRHLEPMVRTSLADTPAVLVNGPRQCGKTTLVRQYADEMPYFSLDDPALLEAVRADPLGFVNRQDRAIIDEVQRAPQLLMALKLAIDQDRRPGRFLLTGSANLMALPQVAESLAGRIEIHALLPLSQSELARRPNDFLPRALNQDWSEPLGGTKATPPAKAADLVERVLAGGYPEMRQRAGHPRRQAWARAYITTLVERDVRDIAQIDQGGRLPRLLAVLAVLSGQLLNLNQIGGQLGLDGKTVDKYIGILEKLFLLRRLPAFSRNELNRLIKAPKIHFLDAGLQSTLTRLTPDHAFTERQRFGATLECWVYGELLKALSITPESWFLSHYRDNHQVEVDFVLESPLREIIGIEVKAAASVDAGDFKGLRQLRQQTGSAFVTGLVLYNGDHPLPFGERLWAVPLRML
jgi:predicted AAA+ superfamily ATPase